MQRNGLSKGFEWAAAVTAGLVFTAGCLSSNGGLTAAGAVVLSFWLAHMAIRRRNKSAPVAQLAPSAVVPSFEPAPPQPTLVDPEDPEALVDALLGQGRFAMLLRPRLAKNIEKEQFQQVLGVLEDAMALVPEGEVMVQKAFYKPMEASGDDAPTGAPCRVAHVDRFFLDRCAVTNEQYFNFVAGGGYQDPTLWDPMILPAVLTFVDETGLPGPRNWRNGRYDPQKRMHPVVGVCWYEAAAYARWAGKRLPTDAEWVKAGSWSVNLSGQGISQRRFPWGDAMERSRANLWGSVSGSTVPVDQYAEGASVGGIYQLIGNVWEWTASDFPPPEESSPPLVVDTPMKSIRGGAYDTYFDNQASCAFQSGDAAIARKQNIGFRCALGLNGLSLSHPACEAAPFESDELPEVPEEQLL
jgi:gamma-glutamyl hercynylcysteine S-oxide synthase